MVDASLKQLTNTPARTVSAEPPKAEDGETVSAEPPKAEPPKAEPPKAEEDESGLSLKLIDMTMRTLFERADFTPEATAGEILDDLHREMTKQREEFLASVATVLGDAGYEVDFDPDGSKAVARAEEIGPNSSSRFLRHHSERSLTHVDPDMRPLVCKYGELPSAVLSFDLPNASTKLRYRKGWRVGSSIKFRRCPKTGRSVNRDEEDWDECPPQDFAIQVRLEVIHSVLRFSVVMNGGPGPTVGNRTNWNDCQPVEPDLIW